MDLNLMKEETLQTILAETVTTSEMAERIALAHQDRVDKGYHQQALEVKSTAEMDALFARWWHAQWIEGVTTRNALLERWFSQVLYDDRVHGVKLPLFNTSTSAIGELTDDSAALVCEPSTATEAKRDDFAYLPQFWCVEVAAEKNPDGSHVIYAVEHIDPIETVRSGEHLCWVLQKNTYTKEWTDGSYHYMQMQCKPGAGFAQWPQGTDRTGKTYAYIGNPKYAAGLLNGQMTSGTHLFPATNHSHTVGVSAWRKRGAQYSGASGCLLKWQLAMVWLKYGRKGNSGVIEGCSNYYVQSKAAVAENGVQRILIPQTEGKNFLVGSTVHIGTSTDRWSADAYSIARSVEILGIEDVSVEGTTYAAVTVDNGGTPFDVTVGAVLSSMPYRSGYNDGVQGYDGSRTSPAGGKEPGLIQRTEFQTGAYLILSDELWKWGTNEAGDFTFDCYTCHDQSKVSGTAITADYTKQEDLTMVFPTGTAGGWQYIEDIAIAKDRGVLWPLKVSTKAGSGTGNKAGMYVGPATDGLRGAWCCCTLYYVGYAGLPARASHNFPGYSSSYGGVGAPGLSG